MITTQIDGTLRCMCGAVGQKKDRKRFRQRHENGACLKCKGERERFAKQLSAGTRSVDDNERQMAREAPEE